MFNVRGLVMLGVAGLVGIWLAYVVGLWAFQDRLMFPVPGGIDRSALDQGAREVGARPLDLQAADGTQLYAWHYPVGNDRLAIYLPGNTETVAHNVALHRLLTQEGWDVLALAYRGYPGSEGHPDEAGLTQDALAVWSWATENGRYLPERIVVHGRNVGGGVAAHLAEQRNPAAVVLESTFVSAKALAQEVAPLAPVGLLFRHPFNTDQRAPRLGVPALVLHSVADEVIPIELGGRGLLPYLAEATYVEVQELRHADCFPVVNKAVREAYVGFLEQYVPQEAT